MYTMYTCTHVGSLLTKIYMCPHIFCLVRYRHHDSSGGGPHTLIVYPVNTNA